MGKPEYLGYWDKPPDLPQVGFLSRVPRETRTISGDGSTDCESAFECYIMKKCEDTVVPWRLSCHTQNRRESDGLLYIGKTERFSAGQEGVFESMHLGELEIEFNGQTTSAQRHMTSPKSHVHSQDPTHFKWPAEALMGEIILACLRFL